MLPKHDLTRFFLVQSNETERNETVLFTLSRDEVEKRSHLPLIEDHSKSKWAKNLLPFDSKFLIRYRALAQDKVRQRQGHSGWVGD